MWRCVPVLIGFCCKSERVLLIGWFLFSLKSSKVSLELVRWRHGALVPSGHLSFLLPLLSAAFVLMVAGGCCASRPWVYFPFRSKRWKWKPDTRLLIYTEWNHVTRAPIVQRSGKLIESGFILINTRKERKTWTWVLVGQAADEIRHFNEDNEVRTGWKKMVSWGLWRTRNPPFMKEVLFSCGHTDFW